MNKISKEEASKLFELFKTAQDTHGTLLFGKHNLSTDAWDRVSENQQEPGKKNNYDG